MITTIRILNLKLQSPNRRKGMTRGAAMAHAAHEARLVATAQLHVAAKALRRYGLPSSVRFVRVAPRRFDSDNCVMAFKPIRDGMCRALGFDDRAIVIAEARPGVVATFEQRAEGPLYAVEIVLTWAEAGTA